MNAPQVTIQPRDDGRHEAWINGELIARLSPYRRNGYGGRITSWRITNSENRVDISSLKPGREHISELQHAALRLWRNRQPEEIKRQAEERRAANLVTARNNVRNFEEYLAAAKATLANLEANSE